MIKLSGLACFLICLSKISCNGNKNIIKSLLDTIKYSLEFGDFGLKNVINFIKALAMSLEIRPLAALYPSHNFFRLIL